MFREIRFVCRRFVWTSLGVTITGWFRGVSDGAQCLFYSVVNMSVIQLMDTVVGEEIIQGFLEKSLIFRIPQGAPYQHRSAVSHVGGDYIAGELRASKVP